MNTKKILMYAGVALAVVVLLLVIWHFYSKTGHGSHGNCSSGRCESNGGEGSEMQHLENFSGLSDDSSSGSDYRLLFFYANWCPHCKAAKPQMEQVKTELEKGPVNGKTVKLVNYDCTEPSPEMEAIMDKYQISSYPTILLVSSDGNVTPFENKPTKDAVMNFLNSKVH